MANFDQILRSMQQQIGFAAGKSRELEAELRNMSGDHALMRQELQRQQRELQNVADALMRVKASGGNAGPGGSVSDHIRYIESIPGRRVPFDMLVDIPIGANATGQQQGTVTVSQDGPFVAVARFAVFQSAFQFQFRDPQTGSLAAFQGRSFGRFRPIHSVNDWADATAGVFNPLAGIAFPGTGAAIYASPSNHSSFRTMEWDGVIEFFNQGAAYPRSNIQVPSAFWVSENNAAFQLAALDFFERGETLQWRVTPTHVNNPQAGNASAYGGPGNPFPFLGSQYDVHEGIVDPLISDADVTTPDPVTRLPDGILTIGFHGYRIIQPPGPVAMT
jgi:hypothetical protein